MKCPSCGTEDINEKNIFCPSCENYLLKNNYAKRAPFLSRLNAFLIDLAAIWGTPIIVLYGLALLLYQQSSLFIVFHPPGPPAIRGAGLSIIWVIVAIIFLLWIGYLVYLMILLGKGSTPGKYLQNLRVINIKVEEDDRKSKSKFKHLLRI